MAFCTNCGISMNDSVTYCPSCGAVALVEDSTGISSNVAGVLSYLLAPVAGIVFLVVAPYKYRQFVRFHAFQSLFFCVTLLGLLVTMSVLTVGLDNVSGGLIGFITLPMDILISMVGLVYWMFLMYSTGNGGKHLIPVLGHFAEHHANKEKPLWT